MCDNFTSDCITSFKRLTSNTRFLAVIQPTVVANTLQHSL